MNVRWLLGIVVVFTTTMAVPFNAVAQETVNQASISGRILDSQGGVVPGASVTARNRDTNLTAETTTDQAGRFRFPYLRVGPYRDQRAARGICRRRPATDLDDRVCIRAADHARRRRCNDRCHRNRPGDRPRGGPQPDCRHRVAGRSPDAADERPELPRSRSAHSGRVADQLGSTQLFAETSAVPGQGISVGSQRNFSNNFIVDGLSANDDAAGLSGMPYGVDAVDEFQVVTSGAQAELGRALGGYINVLTKSGTNVTHGDAYGYFRDERFNAPNALTQTKLPMNQKQYGGSLGGPIVKDRTFYFRQHRATDPRSDRPGHDRPGQRRHDQRPPGGTGYPGATVSTGIYPNPLHIDARPRQDRLPVERPRPDGHPLQRLQRHVRQLAGRRRTQRSQRFRWSGQHRSHHRLQQHDDAVVAKR